MKKDFKRLVRRFILSVLGREFIRLNTAGKVLYTHLIFAFFAMFIIPAHICGNIEALLLLNFIVAGVTTAIYAAQN